MANKTSQEVQEEIIKSCKIQENIISDDNSSGTSPTAKQRKGGQDTTSISVSMKKWHKEKLDKDAKACNMNRSEYITMLITGAKSVMEMPDCFLSDFDSLFRSNFISRVKTQYYLIVLSQFRFPEHNLCRIIYRTP